MNTIVAHKKKETNPTTSTERKSFTRTLLMLTHPLVELGLLLK